jgi:hypothetical protein
MEYTIEYKLAGAITVDAKNRDDAKRKIENMEIEDLLSESDGYILTFRDEDEDEYSDDYGGDDYDN